MNAKNHNLYEVFANQISEYVQAHLDDDINLDDLALKVGVSKYHLNRLFKASTGFQLGEFIQRRRLQKAYSLLATGNFSVIDASLAVGYMSHSSFSRAFLKAFGCKPVEVKIGMQCEWKTPNTIKKIKKHSTSMQAELVDTPNRQYLGLYGAGFKDNSYVDIANSLIKKLRVTLNIDALNPFNSYPIGVSLESPWQTDQHQSRYFIGIAKDGIAEPPVLETFVWQQGTWARFYHKGSYGLLWQTISRVYADWIVPEGIVLRDDVIIQEFLNNPMNTPEADLSTALYFPVQL
jgi:AraC family transcriptional regulator